MSRSFIAARPPVIAALALSALPAAADELVFSVKTWKGDYTSKDVPGGVETTPVESAIYTIHDDGTGFAPSQTREGVGLSRSIRGRMEEVGGRVEIDSRPGSGTEVRLWLPCG